jgi:site-specific DNA recombinase
MTPSNSTHIRKDGTKRKYRYYTCGNFHNKGSSACKANLIKAYEAEDTIFQRIDSFLASKDIFSKTL